MKRTKQELDKMVTDIICRHIDRMANTCGVMTKEKEANLNALLVAFHYAHKL